MLLDIARDKLETAARLLGIERSALTAEKDKLEMLVSYHAQYESSSQQNARNGVTALQMRNATEFLQRLNHAIEQQKAQIKIVDGRISLSVQEVAQAQSEVRKYQTLLERKAEEQRQQSARREQKLSDEYASRLVRHIQE
jgi:flagellar FliJ protein